MKTFHRRVFSILILLSVTTDGLLFLADKKSSQCQVPKGPVDKPYFFGTSDLLCVTTGISLRLKREAQHRSPQAVAHRWIFYNGVYIEFGTDSGRGGKPHIFNDAASFSVQLGLPFMGDKCSWKMEDIPAGFSSLPVECVISCARNYNKVFGKYHLIFNNCHHFANMMSEVLCSNECPPWCVAPMI